MRGRAGAVVTAGACLGLLVALGWAYLAESPRDINLYYGTGLLNPLLAGVLAVGVLVVLAAIRANYLSPAVGGGIVVGFGLVILLVVTVWAVTGRVDIFLAAGWAFPVQRWLLVALSVLLLAGAGWYFRTAHS